MIFSDFSSNKPADHDFGIRRSGGTEPMANTGSTQAKHAYLILCHNNFHQLSLMLELIDDARNDIYIHIDKKVKDAPFEMLKNTLRRANMFFVERVSVTWGGYSLIQAEMNLIKAAAQGSYEYCHLLSGVDLPLKSQDEIHEFFASLGGMQCITYDSIDSCLDRLRYYYPLQEMIGRKRNFSSKLLRRIQWLFLGLQRIFKINRIRAKEDKYYKGSQWVSITGEFAKYLSQMESHIKKCFRHTLIPDEIFMQSVAMASPFKDRLYTDGVHYIDWTRGEPYTFREEDFDLLMSSGKMFARKFDWNTDHRIIEHIYEHVKTS